MKEIEISGKDLATAFGVSDRSIRDFADRGIVAKVGRGKYKLVASVRLYAEHLRGAASGRGGEGAVNELTTERARLAREQADGTALKNAALRRELLPRVDVEREWVGIGRKVRNALLAVPSRVRQSLAHLTAHDVDLIDLEIRAALTGLADGDHATAGGTLVEHGSAAQAEAVGLD